MVDDEIKQAWINFLNPEKLQAHVASISLYVACYEMLKDSIITKIKDFYTNEFIGGMDVVSREYHVRVLSRKSSVLYSSLEWLLEMEAIGEADLICFEKVKACRNDLVHNFHRYIMSMQFPDDFDYCFDSIIVLLNKIEVWWILNLELPINPDLDPEMVDVSQITPGPIMTIQIIREVMSGNTYLLDKFVDAVNSVDN